ncbi:MAG: EscU/YscU/HrcU family type III secretion system export apparatus switch protein [Magnetococcales bacterium]|nr:EscU/YscU/HrcU family type III secretion system export apparatus switch protein [Magnetococcales bacterium]
MGEDEKREEGHIKQAVALRYRKSRDKAPQITASGKGRIADAILKRAEAAGVTLMEDPDLVAVLGKIPVGESVPPDLYKAVAEVLAYVYRINKSFDGEGDS